MINNLKHLTIATKFSILDVCRDPGYASDHCRSSVLVVSDSCFNSLFQLTSLIYAEKSNLKIPPLWRTSNVNKWSDTQ